MIILIDQDGPLADFENGFIKIWKEKYPNQFYVPFEERKTFYVSAQYPQHLMSEVNKTYCSPGFYANLPPVAGCLEAINKMLELGHEVRICTSPLSEYENCVLEKYIWIEKYFGRDFTRRIILTKDKTLIKGDILIDDNPHITGIAEAEWEHILFDYPYNQIISGKRSLNWSNWRQVLNL